MNCYRFIPQHLELVEQYRYSETKEACNMLNSIRSHVGGGWTENCFCDHHSRKLFIKQFNEWFNEIKIEIV